MAAASKKTREDRSRLKVWLDGKLVKYYEAKVPIMTHSVQYGSGIFEGIRAYETKRGAAIFRLSEHIRRFASSCKIYSMELPFSSKELAKAVIDTVSANHLRSCYVRPFAFYNDDSIGVSAQGKKVSVYIATLPFGSYFTGGAKGIRCKISSWRRINSDILPVEAKASGNYLNSLIANWEAKHSGFDEAIFLSADEGYVAEGSGENIFAVRNGTLVTPDASADILLGVTRDSIIKIAKSMGFDVQEREVHKEELYSADEVFFTGTAAEVTPIVNVDGIRIGQGRPGPMTMELARKYYAIAHGEDTEFQSWLTYVR